MKSNYKLLGEYIEIVSRVNSDLKYGIDDVRGCSNTKKMMQTRANLIGRTYEKFIVLKPQEFVFNRRTTRNGERIGMAYNDTDREYIFTNDYVAFRVRKECLSKLLPEFLYLFFCRDEFDRYARYKSTGSATEFFNWEDMCAVPLEIPDIEFQKTIVKAYQVINERMENIKSINDILVEQVATLYTELIKDKEPNGILSDIAAVCSGKRPSDIETGDIPLVGASTVMAYINDFNFDEPILVIGRVGTHGIVQRFSSKCWASDNTLVINSVYYEYVYQFLRKVDYTLLNRGSTQPLITQTDLNNLPIYIPDIKALEYFESIANEIMVHYSMQNKELAYLETLSQTVVNLLSVYS